MKAHSGPILYHIVPCPPHPMENPSKASWGQFLQPVPDLIFRIAQLLDISNEDVPFYQRDVTWKASCTVVPDTWAKTFESNRLCSCLWKS